MLPKNVQPEMLRTPPPKVKKGGVGFPAAFGIHHYDPNMIVSKNML